MKQRSSRYPLTVLLVLTWTMLVLGLYYWVHKPLTPPLAQAASGALLDGGVAAGLAIVAGGLGRRILQSIHVMSWSAAERVAAAELIGLSLLALMIFGVGVIVLNPISMIALLALVAIFTWRDLGAWGIELVSLARKGLPVDRWSRFLALTALVMILLALLLALLPPSKWDILTYHLAGPEQYVEHGRFYAVRHNHFLGFPQLVETLYAGQLALTGRLAGSGLLHWVIGGSVLLMAGGYVASRASTTAGWLTVNILLTATTIWREMSFAYVDLMPVGLAIVGLALAECWDGARQDQDGTHEPHTNTKHLLLMGMTAGLGMGTKYTALWLAIALGVLILWLGRRDGWRACLAYSAIYGLAAAITLAPWLIRNATWYNNPVYPFVFESAEMDSIRQDWYSQPDSGLVYRSAAWQLPILPITATFLGVEGSGTYNTDIGPLFLILLPLVWLSWQHLKEGERKPVLQALIVVGVMFVAWEINTALGSYINIQTRLVLYMFGPLAVVAGITGGALQRLPKKPLDLGFILQAMIALTLVFMVINAIRYTNNSGLQIYFSGEDDYEKEYLNHALGWHYETMRQINQLPEGATVRFLWEPRYLYCDNERLDCYTDSLMDGWYYARRTTGSPAAIAAQWQSTGIDYLLVYEFGRKFECGPLCDSSEAGNEFYNPEDWAAWDKFTRLYLDELWRNGNSADDIQYILYRWQD